MLTNFFEIIWLIKYPLIGLFMIFVLLSFYWNPVFKFLKLKPYNNVQRVHKNEISRLGGLAIYIFFWVLFFLGFVGESLFFHLLVSAAPMGLIALKEDLFHNTTPKARLLLMIVSCSIFFYINPVALPVIDIPYISQIISFYPVNILFFTFSIMVIMNGMNLIDGMNGLFGFSALTQLISILIIAFGKNDLLLVNLSIVLSLPLIIFLFFNFPFGKVFIGDFGAYFYGFVNSLLIIYLFGKYQDLLTWLAVVILIYPSIELLFSYIRKTIKNKSPFAPDDIHLHTLIYKKNFRKQNSSLLLNSKTTLILCVFWASPILFIILGNFQILSLFKFILLFMLFYVYLYFHYSKK